jgi:hypothetical protein
MKNGKWKMMDEKWAFFFPVLGGPASTNCSCNLPLPPAPAAASSAYSFARR